MSDLTIEQPRRIFKLGSLRLDDPDPSLPPEQAIALYAPVYPQAADAELSPPTLDGDNNLVYEVQRAPAKTKG